MFLCYIVRCSMEQGIVKLFLCSGVVAQRGERDYVRVRGLRSGSS